MTLSENYSNLKDQVILTVGSTPGAILPLLKDIFRKTINSVRRFEHITTIGQLLRVLELRGILSEDDVEPLKDIANTINNKELLNLINRFERGIFVNHSISTEKYANIGSSPPSYNIQGGILNISSEKKERIYAIVVQSIGTSWRHLARSLKIQECKIDDIDFNHKSLATKASKMIALFDENANQRTWYFVICEALENIKRKDILRSIKEKAMEI